MKRSSWFAVGVSVVSLFLFGCSRDDGVRPDSGSARDVPTAEGAAGTLNAGGPVPGGYYAFFFETFAYSAFNRIDTRNGQGTPLWSIGLEPYPGDDRFGPTPFGLAFDVDGSMYTTVNLISFDRALCQSQFARVDALTGAVTLIGAPFPINTSGGDIDACGNYYTCGFEVPHLGYIFGDSNLYRIDKTTGVRTLVGDTGMTDWMDLAFDSHGRLYATTQNKLFTLDTQTGARTFVTDIHGVPDADAPHNMEVMSIAFDERDVLYATAMTVFWDDPRGSPTMRIDPATGAATVIGYTHQYYNHGGDFMPTKTRVCHRGKVISISMNALAAHLAHGDFVPGSAGHACDSCPGLSASVTN